MKYGIYDLSLEQWVKKNYRDFLGTGIPMTEEKLDALTSEDPEFVTNVMYQLAGVFGIKSKIMEDLEMREL